MSIPSLSATRLQDRVIRSDHATRHRAVVLALPGPGSPGALLASAGGAGTHALVEHVCLVPQLCVLAQVLPDHLYPLHLQPLQLLRRRRDQRALGMSSPSGDLPTTQVPDHHLTQYRPLPTQT